MWLLRPKSPASPQGLSACGRQGRSLALCQAHPGCLRHLPSCQQGLGAATGSALTLFMCVRKPLVTSQALPQGMSAHPLWLMR